MLVIACSAAQAFELKLATENDILTSSDDNDDLYTFSVAFEVQRGPYLFALREHAFTDRRAGVRLDETWLTAKRALPSLGRFDAQVEAGIAHVGRGLFGQQAQNAVHRAIGDEELDLLYYRPSVHPALGLEIERVFRVGRSVALGPRFELHGAPGLRSDALIGAQAAWRVNRQVLVELLAGARATRADLPPLAPHLEPVAPVARIGLVIHDTIYLSWAHNTFGDGRQHISLGYWTPLGDPKRNQERTSEDLPRKRQSARISTPTSTP
jgi:hypothetical protein